MRRALLYLALAVVFLLIFAITSFTGRGFFWNDFTGGNERSHGDSAAAVRRDHAPERSIRE
jgi:hypothetical protein